MSTYQKYKENIKQTNEARRAAVRVLIANHREEFDALYLAQAEVLGLNPTKIKAKVKQAEEASKTEEQFRSAVAAEVEKILTSAALNTSIEEIEPAEIY